MASIPAPVPVVAPEERDLRLVRPTEEERRARVAVAIREDFAVNRGVYESLARR